MKKVIIFSILMLVGFAFSCQKDEDAADPYEGGQLHKSPSGAFYITQLEGTFKQMGRQYGLMLSDQIQAFYQEAVVELAMNEEGMKYEDLLEYGSYNYNDFPQIFRDYFDGIAETSGLTVDQTKIM